MADHSDLCAMLAEVLADEPVHAKRILKAATIVEEAIRREGLEATLVGGGAVEIYAPGAYTTTDIDLVIPRSVAGWLPVGNFHP